MCHTSSVGRQQLDLLLEHRDVRQRRARDRRRRLRRVRRVRARELGERVLRLEQRADRAAVQVRVAKTLGAAKEDERAVTAGRVAVVAVLAVGAEPREPGRAAVRRSQLLFLRPVDPSPIA